MMRITWIQEQQKLEAEVLKRVEFEFSQTILNLIEGLRDGWYPQKSQSQEIELLSVGQSVLIWESVMHPLMHVIQYEEITP